MNEAVKALSETGMFSNVSARIVGGHVVVKVVESTVTVLNRVAFEGNSKIKGDQLPLVAHSKAQLGIQRRRSATADLDRIKDAYKKFGHSAKPKVLSPCPAKPNGREDPRLHHRRG